MNKNKILTEAEELIKRRNGLPHIYGYKMYPWMKQFFNATNKVSLVCSANQIGKSSIQIRKLIHLATEPQLQKVYWPHLTPRQFWYLYPSNYVATIEVEKKWIPEFLPRGSYKNDPQYGWRTDYRQKYVQALHFNTGISIYFKTYQQDPQDLQAGTAAYVATDEELPEELFPELQARLFATDGYFSAVFTPTLGQEFWREAIEERGSKQRFPDALKLQVSMYDCMKYVDGTPSHWTHERIQQVINSCKSENEVQRRVFGKFVLDSGLKYPAFNPSVNVIDPRPIPDDWPVFVGVDSGSGGRFSHPSAITFTAFRPDFQLAYVFKGRRFDGIPTTNSDLVMLTRQLKSEIRNPIYGVFYDYAATDLRTIAYQMGEAWIPAEKSHLIGEQFINVALKNKMMFIFNTEELYPLIHELKSLKISTPKNQAKDDFCDSMRYSITKAPWSWDCISGDKPVEPKKEKTETDLRREFVLTTEDQNLYDVEREIEEYNELFDNYDY